MPLCGRRQAIKAARASLGQATEPLLLNDWDLSPSFSLINVNPFSSLSLSLLFRWSVHYLIAISIIIRHPFFIIQSPHLSLRGLAHLNINRSRLETNQFEHRLINYIGWFLLWDRHYYHVKLNFKAINFKKILIIRWFVPSTQFIRCSIL